MGEAKPAWVLPVQKLVYAIQFDREPVESVERLVGLVLQQKALTGPPAEYLASARQALDSSVRFADLIPQPHSEETIREFLAAFAQRLAKSIETGDRPGTV